MTREELEEFRSLLQAWSDAGSANDGSVDIDATYDALCCFMTENADAFLCLAEEARWRSVAEEPPGVSRFLGIRAGCIEEYEIEEDGEITWNGGSPVKTEYLPTHWRPLPKGPER